MSERLIDRAGVKKLISEAVPHSPIEGIVQKPFLRTPEISAAFSQDILDTRKLYHLSIAHIKSTNPDFSNLLNAFNSELGNPVLTFETNPVWVINGKEIVMHNHHFFW